SLPLVGARLEVDVHRAALGAWAGGLDGAKLGMRLPEGGMITLSHPLAVAYEHGTHQRVWRGLSPSAAREPEGPRHESLVGDRGHVRSVVALHDAAGTERDRAGAPRVRPLILGGSDDRID